MKSLISIISSVLLVIALFFYLSGQPASATGNSEISNTITITVTYAGDPVENATVSMANSGGLVRGPVVTGKEGTINFNGSGLSAGWYTISASRDTDCANLPYYYEGNGPFIEVPLTSGCTE